MPGISVAAKYLSAPLTNVCRIPLSHNLIHPSVSDVDQWICILTSCHCPVANGVSKIEPPWDGMLIINDQNPFSLSYDACV